MKKVLSFALLVGLCMSLCSVLVLAKKEGDFRYTIEISEDEFAGYYAIVTDYEGDEEVVAIPETMGGYLVQVIETFKKYDDDWTTKEVVIPNTVREIEQFAFYHCKNLEKITIPGSVEEIGIWAFYTEKLKEVNLHDGLVTIERLAFVDCDDLTELYIPKTVQNVGENGDFRSAFSSGEFKHLKVIVDPENEYYMSDENGWVYTKDGKTLLMACSTGKTVKIPEGVTEIKDKVFYNWNEIQEVILPTTLEKIGKSAFSMCPDIKKIELPNSLRYIGETAFSGCWWLTKLTFGTNLEYIANGAFMWCGNLKEVTFLNPKTKIAEFSQTTDMDSARRTVTTKYGTFHLSGIKTVNCYLGSTAYDYFTDENNVKYFSEYYTGDPITIVPIIKITVNDEVVKTGTASCIKNDRTMVPMRAIFEALGATVSWDDSTKTAIGVKDGVEVKITIGENVLYKNGEATLLDAAAEITNDRTMVPVRAISEAFGCTVNWNDETKTVEITN